MALSGAHNSIKVQQSPLMQSTPVQTQTHSHNAVKLLLINAW